MPPAKKNDDTPDAAPAEPSASESVEAAAALAEPTADTATPTVDTPADTPSAEPAPPVVEVTVDKACTVSYQGMVVQLAEGQKIAGPMADYLARTGAPVTVTATAEPAPAE